VGEERLASKDVRVDHVTPGRYAEVAGIESDLGEDVVADFRLTAVRQGAALGLLLGAVAAAEQATAQAHVVEESVGILLGEIRLASFPAKAPDHRLPRELIVDPVWATGNAVAIQDRKSTRLNSSHVKISYAVFCL